MPQFDPRDRVTVTSVKKRGAWYTVQGVADGKKASVDIPAPSLDGRPASAAEALMRRSLLGSTHPHE